MSSKAKFLDAVFAGAFKTDASGRTVYFPNGAMGRGYIVPDEATLVKIKRKLRWYFVSVVLLATAASPFTSTALQRLDTPMAIVAGALAILLLTLAGYGVGRSFAAGLEPSDTKLTMQDAVRSQAKALPRWFNTFQLVIWTLGVLGGLLMLSQAANTSDVAGAALAIGCSLLLLALAVWSRRAQSAG